MNMKTKLIISATALSSVATAVHADIVFQDDFESGLSLWTGRNDRGNHGVLGADPLGGLSTVLSFDKLGSGGDMYTKNAFSLDPEGSYTISFDYLGLAKERSNPSDTGGYIGFSVDTPGLHSWQWATGSASGASDVLIDDGQWHSYNFDFSTADLRIGSSVRLMLEDFRGSGGTTGDAFFDNFQIATVPAPGTVALLCLSGVCTMRRKRS